MEINHENYIELKAKKLKRAEIAEIFNVPEWKLKRVISTNKWGKVPPTIKNENSFSNINEESCYWAGFLAADGNVDSKNRVRLMLNYDDTGHLLKFKNWLDCTYVISSNTTEYYRSSFEFTNKKIVEDLKLNFKIVPNKTSILEFPDLRIGMLKHYIRGYFDGDGSVCESFSNKNSCTTSLYASFCCGSTNFANDLYKVLSNHLLLGGSNTKIDKKYNIKYNTNDAKILLNWMYKDSLVYLDRKYEKYIKLVVNDDRSTR